MIVELEYRDLFFNKTFSSIGLLVRWLGVEIENDLPIVRLLNRSY